MYQCSPQEGEEDLHSEYDYDEEIDPLEKEWMLASAQADIDGLQRLMMTDPTLLNRRGFLHGYTALHWAAKHGRMDILSMLLIQGALTNVKTVSSKHWLLRDGMLRIGILIIIPSLSIHMSLSTGKPYYSTILYLETFLLFSCTTN